MLIPILAADLFTNFIPKVIMDWWVPALFAAGIFTFVIYKMLQQLGYIDW